MKIQSNLLVVKRIAPLQKLILALILDTPPAVLQLAGDSFQESIARLHCISLLFRISMPAVFADDVAIEIDRDDDVRPHGAAQ